MNISEIAVRSARLIDNVTPAIYANEKMRTQWLEFVSGHIAGLLTIAILGCADAASKVAQGAGIQPANVFGEMVAKLHGLTADDLHRFQEQQRIEDLHGVDQDLAASRDVILGEIENTIVESFGSDAKQ